MAKISIKYVLPTSIWKYFWRISRYFAFWGEYRGISWVRDRSKYQKPWIQEISDSNLETGRYGLKSGVSRII